MRAAEPFNRALGARRGFGILGRDHRQYRLQQTLTRALASDHAVIGPIFPHRDRSKPRRFVGRARLGRLKRKTQIAIVLIARLHITSASRLTACQRLFQRHLLHLGHALLAEPAHHRDDLGMVQQPARGIHKRVLGRLALLGRALRPPLLVGSTLLATSGLFAKRHLLIYSFHLLFRCARLSPSEMRSSAWKTTARPSSPTPARWDSKALSRSARTRSTTLGARLIGSR